MRRHSAKRFGAFLLSLCLAVGVATLLALSSPFVRYTLVHTWAEAPLAFFLVLAALLAAQISF